jgi:hypothetical protein
MLTYFIRLPTGFLAAVEDIDTAEAKNTILPDRFKWVPKNALFFFRFSVRRNEPPRSKLRGI